MDFLQHGLKLLNGQCKETVLTLDPHAQNEGPTTQVSRQIYEALVERAVDMKIQPALATEWKTTDPNYMGV